LGDDSSHFTIEYVMNSGLRASRTYFTSSLTNMNKNENIKNLVNNYLNMAECIHDYFGMNPNLMSATVRNIKTKL